MTGKQWIRKQGTIGHEVMCSPLTAHYNCRVIERTSERYVYREFSVTAPPRFRTKRLIEVSGPCSASIIVIATIMGIKMAWNRQISCSANTGRD